MKHLTIHPSENLPPTRDHPQAASSLPEAKQTKVHPAKGAADGGEENASLLFVGTATTV
ncbi:MAG: hypothetical protein Q9184_008344, partial [Pyrenodesmia sp. 2 TL-2023]